MWSAVVHDYWRAVALIDHIDIIPDIKCGIKWRFIYNLIEIRILRLAGDIRRFIDSKTCNRGTITINSFPDNVLDGCIDLPIFESQPCIIHMCDGEYKIQIIRNVWRPVNYIINDINKFVVNLARADGRMFRIKIGHRPTYVIRPYINRGCTETKSEYEFND